MTIPLEALDEFSRQFLEWLCQRRPELAEVAEVDENWTSALKPLVIRLHPPQADLPQLEISSENDEVSLFYDRWHAHFAFFADQPDEKGFQEALDCLDEILQERVAIAISMVGDEWRGSGTWPPGESLPEPPTGGRVYIRSWRGTFNREEGTR
jgi:hypothetical protein